jgi:anti-anti-sigma factor
MLETVATEHPPGYRLIGELDVSNADSVGDMLEGEILAGRDLSLDLSGLTFMDSSGLKVVYRLARAASRRGGAPVTLRSPARSVQRLFDIALPATVPGIRVVTDPPAA